MTQEEFKSKIQRLKCCSGEMSNEVVNNLTNGDRDCRFNISNIMILNDIINLLLKYDLTEGATNCLTINEFTDIYDRAINLCKICDCQ